MLYDELECAAKERIGVGIAIHNLFGLGTPDSGSARQLGRHSPGQIGIGGIRGLDVLEEPPDFSHLGTPRRI